MVLRSFKVVAIMGLFVLLGAWPALADPPGNNGTVKVDGEEFDTHPDNEPHPGCIFEIDFYGFGPNLDATSTFYAWPPTGNMEQVYSVVTKLDGDDSQGGGSEAGYDGTTGPIDLLPYLGNSVEHPQQGFHVKLQVDVPEGSDSQAYSKYKVFWVGCEVYPPVEDRTNVTGGQASGFSPTDTGTSPVLPIAIAGLAAAAATGAVMVRRSGTRTSRARGR
ncbi:MAG TPA: hypothetical protein VIG53_05400 [Actinomycetota bacterium]|jgi:hypothetical protein